MTTVRNVRVAIVLAFLVAALAVFMLARSEGAAKASSVNVTGVSPAQFADHAITLTAPTGEPAVSESQAQSTAQKLFNHSALDTQLANCAQGDLPAVLCWVVVVDPSGDEITTSSPDPNVTPTRVLKVDYEYVLVDANTDDVIIAVQHAPGDRGGTSDNAGG